MHDDVEDQNRHLDDMGDSFGSVSSQMKRTVTQIQVMLRQPENKRIVLVAGSVLTIFIIYKLFA